MALPRPDDPLPPLTGLRSWWSAFARAAPSPREERSADDTPMFGAPLPEALKQSSVAISLINQDGEQYVWGYVPAVVAKIGLFLKQHGTLCALACAPAYTQLPTSKACSASTDPKSA